LAAIVLTLPPDPFHPDGIAGFASRLRRGETSAEAVTSAYLARIQALDPHFGAFELVDSANAIATARAHDRLLASGTDLGPLMGVPVGVKDIVAVKGAPTRAGSKLDVADLIGGEGAFVAALKRAGTVIVGKTKTAEFAIGRGGANAVRGTPKNPWARDDHVIPGGSSSGSGVAVAAGLCAFAIGSDTGGSVRLPATHCGIFGLKTTKGLWPTDGVFPLSPTLDTLGLLTASAADAAIAFAALAGRAPSQAHPGPGLRLGRAKDHLFEQLDAEVAACVEVALSRLCEAGVELVDIEIPETADMPACFDHMVPAELITNLGRTRASEGLAAMDPVSADRVRAGLDLAAGDYVAAVRRHRAWREGATSLFRGIDGIVAPTSPSLPSTLGEAVARADDPQRRRATSVNTVPANMLGATATTTPIHAFGSSLPVGLQIICPGGAEDRALSIALLLEKMFGPPPRADVERVAG
jgi:aspartyl-tRNA(Asn)/glutamyl-tRNA(Gln) amidotransferase subunit A